MQPVLVLRTVPRGARVWRGVPMNAVLLPQHASDDRGESLKAENNEFSISDVLVHESFWSVTRISTAINGKP